MRAVVQRVSSAAVEVDGEAVGRCGQGLLLLVAVHRDDDEDDAQRLADRVFGLRIFNDEDGKINLSLPQLQELQPSAELGILAISNFTVYGDADKSRRPSFTASAGFEKGKLLFDLFTTQLASLGARVQMGVFGADMQVHSTNDGPVTVIVQTR